MKLKKVNKGFTLIELMVVIMILGLLAAFVIPNITGKSGEAKQKLVCIQMKSLNESLKMFKIDNGEYPTTEEGLSALILNPNPDTYTSYASSAYIEGKNLPKDPWNKPYLYLNVEGAVELISLGSDGKEGGSEEEKDHLLSQCR
ncbi:MAG: type II secretion system major pseudopilin GspG [Sulfuricurvum sp.]|uniref:type II secretion system major pseudopilin GspG n=1 Tax=Sulfuricurvum sp. TaxID=2025608 RepID=UPI0027324B28|nr:type II secretion system major pseudopilin GspG [Sulfuricurvum sp.]MDP2851297.1 type II secretion system major pseudopilin GspG [Sulfuricurvum sp.]MDP3292865.1 type II secretion system major pseudopilin GspG [Sulfuricurvum sp.]